MLCNKLDHVEYIGDGTVAFRFANGSQRVVPCDQAAAELDRIRDAENLG